MELFKAHQQWSNRPVDETFESVKAMHEACAGYRQISGQKVVAIDSLRVENSEGEIHLIGKAGVPAKLTHWSFGQLCTRAGAPAGYLRQLPATLAAQNLNHGLANLDEPAEDDDRKVSLLFHQNGSLVLRAATSEKYSRIWNSDVTQRLVELQERQPEWTLPLAYVREPGTKGFDGLTNKMAPRGAYASDHDMFCFLVDETKRVAVEGSTDGLRRGFFVWNSEVGAASFGIMSFLYDMVCGNHIVWGAKQVSELRIRHIGDASPKAFRELTVELRKYADSSVSEIEAQIQTARGTLLGATKEDVLDAILGKRIPELSRKRLDAAYDAAEQSPRYGSPRSVWGMVNGLTEISQKTPHADERNKLDRAAGKLMEVVF